MTQRIVVASSNPGKLREIGAILADHDIEVVPLAAWGIPEPVETGSTFIENAIIKARHAALHSGLSAIADDSGLVVDALGGAPGVRSARYAGLKASDAENNAKLLRALHGVPPERRTARYRCVVVWLAGPDDPSPLIGEGTWEGIILSAPRGAGGFGYDPLFFVPESGCTAAELEMSVKNQLSHRHQALQALFRKRWGGTQDDSPGLETTSCSKQRES